VTLNALGLVPGCSSPIGVETVRSLLVRKVRATKLNGCGCRCAGLDAHLPGCTYARPRGGYFMWVELPRAFPADAEALLARASDPAAEPQVGDGVYWSLNGTNYVRAQTVRRSYTAD
jgi:DNA-binding transcriptional MocR family regulator